MKGWGEVLREHAGPLLFAGGFLIVIVVLIVLPPVASVAPATRQLAIFPTEPDVRVLLRRLDGGEVLRPPGRFRVIAPQEDLVFEAGTRIRLVRGAVLVGQHEIPLPVRLSGTGDAGLSLDGRTYPGVVDLVPDEKRVLVVNQIPLETYLVGVIAAEMGTSFPDEALKAQAIVGRSFAAYRMRQRRRDTFHLRNDQRDQVYRGLPSHAARLHRLVQATRARVVAFDGKLLEALYSSTCGGGTRPAGEAFGGSTLPPLSGVECDLCRVSPHYRWTKRVPVSRVRRALDVRGSGLGFSDPRPSATGRLGEVTVVSSAGRRTAPVSRLRRALGGTKSSWITRLAVEGDHVVAEGRGFGHGVGLCQFGARTLARSGWTGDEIIAHYFPESEAALLYPAVP